MPESFLENIDIKITRSALRDDLICLYKDADWWESSYDENPEFLDHIIKDSAIFVGAFMDQQLIGMGRVLSDLVSDAFIQDVVVLKRYRGNSIGKKIIQLLISQLQKRGVDWIGLVAQPGTASFYQELGFEVLKDHVPMKYKIER